MANNSFKPSPLRGLGRASQHDHSAAAAKRPGLTQALALKKSWVLFAVFGDNRFPRGTA